MPAPAAGPPAQRCCRRRRVGCLGPNVGRCSVAASAAAASGVFVVGVWSAGGRCCGSHARCRRPKLGSRRLSRYQPTDEVLMNRPHPLFHVSQGRAEVTVTCFGSTSQGLNPRISNIVVRCKCDASCMQLRLSKYTCSS